MECKYERKKNITNLFRALLPIEILEADKFSSFLVSILHYTHETRETEHSYSCTLFHDPSPHCTTKYILTKKSLVRH